MTPVTIGSLFQVPIVLGKKRSSTHCMGGG